MTLCIIIIKLIEVATSRLNYKFCGLEISTHNCRCRTETEQGIGFGLLCSYFYVPIMVCLLCSKL